jgi:hypothetical protein
MGGNGSRNGNGIQSGVFEKHFGIIHELRLFVYYRGRLEPVGGKIANIGKIEIRVLIEIPGQVRPPVAISDKTYFHFETSVSLSTQLRRVKRF